MALVMTDLVVVFGQNTRWHRKLPLCIPVFSFSSCVHDLALTYRQWGKVSEAFERITEISEATDENRILWRSVASPSTVNVYV